MVISVLVYPSVKLGSCSAVYQVLWLKQKINNKSEIVFIILNCNFFLLERARTKVLCVLFKNNNKGLSLRNKLQSRQNWSELLNWGNLEGGWGREWERECVCMCMCGGLSCMIFVMALYLLSV